VCAAEPRRPEPSLLQLLSDGSAASFPLHLTPYLLCATRPRPGLYMLGLRLALRGREAIQFQAPACARQTAVVGIQLSHGSGSANCHGGGVCPGSGCLRAPLPPPACCGCGRRRRRCQPGGGGVAGESCPSTVPCELHSR